MPLTIASDAARLKAASCETIRRCRRRVDEREERAEGEGGESEHFWANERRA